MAGFVKADARNLSKVDIFMAILFKKVIISILNESEMPELAKYLNTRYHSAV